MEKRTAIVGFFLSALAGMFLMYAIDRARPGMGPDKATAQVAAAADTSSPIPIGADDPKWGKADAPVTIVEISDFQCPFCSKVEPTLKQLKDQYGPDKIRVVWKNNPLPFHQMATPAAEAAVAVYSLGGDDAFWKFHDLAFTNQKDLSEDNFAKWAAESGVDAAKFKAARADKKTSDKVKADLEGNRKLGATGTPAFRINGVVLSGAQPIDRFKQVIDEQLKKADDLIKKGTAKNQVSVQLTKENFKAQPAGDDKKAQEPPKEDTTVWRITLNNDDPVKGAKDALVTIVEWSDFQCPFCSRVEPTIAQIMEKYGKDVRVVWKDNALPFHKMAMPAANLGRLAYAKGGDALFWKVHDKMFGDQKLLTDEGLIGIGKEFGLSESEVKDAVAGKYKERIQASIDQASDMNANGTPHFFINGRRLSGAQPFEKFEALIKEQMTIAQGLVAKGVARDKVYDEIMKTAKGPQEPEKKDVPAPTANNAVKGAKNGKILIQEFSDFECPYCGRAVATVEQVMKEYGDQVQFVWRHMPLPFHSHARPAAEAAQEAFAQQGSAGFWKYHDKLYANQKALERADLEKYASEIGLDMARFKKALDEHTHAKEIDADVEVANKVGVKGTPAFTINGYFLSGAQPFPQFQKMIKLAQSGK
ncbi:MAG TPA: thioredoxin domain-containing protein [Polyangiaceae bacterium]|jgi:protein-disulfide isomerase|nr:thioredoxin domain-containing protein [Polyangiaceae bacterium]